MGRCDQTRDQLEKAKSEEALTLEYLKYHLNVFSRDFHTFAADTFPLPHWHELWISSSGRIPPRPAS
jgi:hypothetical protein